MGAGAAQKFGFPFRDGAAYVFRYDGTNWVERQQVRAPDGHNQDRFGDTVALSGRNAVVGAPLDDKAVAEFPLVEGTQDWVDTDGTHYDIDVTLDEVRCRVAFASRSGRMVWTYETSESGLALTTELTSPVLPDAVVWTADYRAFQP